jgi:FkbM family methyltransferase
MILQSNGITDGQLEEIINSLSPTIIECGAHDGRDTKRFLNIFPMCHVYCFEPDPRPVERRNPPGFIDRIGNDPRVTFIPAAVGDTDSITTLYRSSGSPPNKCVEDWDHSSSIRRPTGHLVNSPWCLFPEDKQVQVPVVRLDTWATNWLDSSPIDLLWVDVQGGQRAMIAGGLAVLASTKWLYIECHRVPQYDTEPTHDELIALLSPLGLRPQGLYEGYNFLFKNTNL